MEDKQLKEILETFWTSCAPKNHLAEMDDCIEGVDGGDAGATRLAPSGKTNGDGSEVRIKFSGPKR